MLQDVHDLDEALQRADQPLMGMRLLKSLDQESEDGPWKFRGVASDETEDVEGDKILRKSLDVSYAARRGYVNWDHWRGPENQIGYLTHCEVLTLPRIEELAKSITDIKETATCYVEGELYKHVPRAVSTHNLLKSIPEDGIGPGLSLDGSIARAKATRGIIKAFVRGVAITPAPVHPQTVARLKKSLQAYTELEGTEQLSPDFIDTLAKAVAGEMRKSLQPGSKAMSHDEAVIFLLQRKPTWTYDVASKLVKYTMQNLARGA